MWKHEELNIVVFCRKQATIQDVALVYQPPTIAKLKSQLTSISSQFKGG